VLDLLSSLDADLLRSSECWFGGGTAVSLRCGEPRVSKDVDFLCASHDGYRRLRQHVFGRDAQALFRVPIVAVRELRADRYGLRTAVRIGDAVIKLELISEGRIPLGGTDDPELPVSRLADVDLVAEKLLANVDRGADDVSLSRDIVDLLLLEETLGALPEASFEKARSAYGDSVDRAFAGSLARLASDVAQRERFFELLGLAEDARAMIRSRVARSA